MQRGLAKGDRVIIALPNCPEFIYSYLGAARAGGIAVPLNLLHTPRELAFIIKDSGAKFLITNQFIGQQIKQLPNLDLTVTILDENSIKEILSSPPAAFPEVKSEDTCTFLYTSGTTGQPKAVMLSHDNLIGNVISMDEAAKFGRDENFLVVLPMFHSFGWSTSVLLPLYIGCTATIIDTFRPKELLQILSKERITIFCGVPSMFTVLLKTRRQTTFPTLKYAISGGDSISEEHMLAFEKLFNFPVIEGYGLSEASPVVCLNPLYGVRKIKSIGVPLPGVEVKVADDDDRELPSGEIGELLVKGPNVMKGYYNREEETRSALKGGWLHTGDLAYRDQDGYFYIVGRKKELIITSGFNVYPKEVEEVLTAHPTVAEAAVIGVPHPVKGESIKAFIVPEEGRTPDKQELLRFLKGHLAGYKIPETFVISSELPRGATGKILKRMLK
ncbi:acyl-CoA synthetases (AMP-forming)/AMP-acid ligases II [Pelotomaculum thermopropionicum SI]|uniref:Acyl-CoA synthetases (AMP-forming)/AMP-acid ligases II n=1 Tax=Pelotomaculum thermopropionicum (strain DSM 13744 / JCM 10971 / SI) TaxID=370438 RepID=A5D2H2_PELTS|nr:acyl-CoA synthetases (AMP-forming)/AMP-acid ligases II [Pelotomaculum thermopropionicum SI]